MGEIVAADLPFKEQEITRDAGHRILQQAQRAVQGRAGAGHPRGRAHHLALARRLRRPLPRRSRASRPARSRRSSCSRSPAPTGAATRRTRCSSASTAPPSPTRSALDEYLKQREEAEKRDHRKLGKELGLFAFHPLGAGRGVLAAEGHRRSTPRCQSSCAGCSSTTAATSRSRRRCSINQQLWETSGHWQHYARQHVQARVRGAGVRPQADELPLAHACIYQHGAAQLPRPAAALCTTQDVLHRNEASGTLSGLTRVRAVPAGRRAHLPARSIRSRPRSPRSSRWSRKVYAVFGLEYDHAALDAQPRQVHGRRSTTGTRPKQRLAAALTKNHIAYRASGADEAAFYGPKIDIQM